MGGFMAEELKPSGARASWDVRDLKVLRGSPLPFGPRLVPGGVNFALFSRHAMKVDLLLFEDPRGEPAWVFPLDPSLHKTGDVWHVEVAGLGKGALYAWRVQGPWDPEGAGHRFDPGYFLLDPYARALAGGEEWGRPVFVPGGTRKKGLGTILKGVVLEDHFDWEGDQPLGRPLADTIIYEMHVRGFTRHPSSGVAAPGTFKGVVEKLPYLKSLGINAVELMPVAEFVETGNIRRNPKTGERLLDYWGYNPVAFFAPKASYASRPGGGGQVREFREMVKALHAEGIEVILDVVFNHTGEGDGSGPVLSFKGLGNTIYYLLGEGGAYRNYTGCGNTLNCNHPLVRDLILDCLRYWVMEMHVDGFRFDLASVLGRGRNGEVLADPPVLERIAEDPVLAGTKIIAEAWDAAGLYQVGSFPAWGRWAEWNGKFRDDVRRFVRGDFGMVPALATRIAGSSDLYQAGGRAPYHSVNFVTSHDGFTLWDLVSYNGKHNEANGEENRDGGDDNWSWNHGVEGPTEDPKILDLRKRQAKNFLTILMVSQGVPMTLMGDEILRTQGGNNNAYCQDNETSWMDWGKVRENGEMLRFFRMIVLFRRRHAVLRRRHFFAGMDHDGDQLPDISWHGVKTGSPDWSPSSRALAFLLDGSESCGGEADDDIFVALNAHDAPLAFEIPYFKEGYGWRKVVDTARKSPKDIVNEEKAPFVRGSRLRVKGRSAVILVSKPLEG